MIRRVNRWFDDLREPDRTSVFFVFLMLFSLLTYWPVVWLVVAGTLLAIRVWWLYWG